MASWTKPEAKFSTPVTEMLGIQHPIILAGMNAVANADLAAAVSNAGGLGVFGGLTMKPKVMRETLEEVKRQLRPEMQLTAHGRMNVGVDLAIPQIGGGARKTNHDYTGGKLAELIDIICEYKVAIFVCAIGVPPRWAVDKMHAAGVLVMNMVGSPRNAVKAIEAGVDMLCAQGTEGGGHTGEIGTSVLIPACVDVVRKGGYKSPLTGNPVQVVGAGGITDGRSLAMALSLGASAVWVGTRFIACTEAGGPDRHKNGVVTASPTDTIRSLVYSGRPIRTRKTEYLMTWEDDRKDLIKELCDKGIVPIEHDFKSDNPPDVLDMYPLLMGQNSMNIHEIKSAREIVDDMLSGCADTIATVSQLQTGALTAKL